MKVHLKTIHMRRAVLALDMTGQQAYLAHRVVSHRLTRTARTTTTLARAMIKVRVTFRITVVILGLRGLTNNREPAVDREVDIRETVSIPIMRLRSKRVLRVHQHRDLRKTVSSVSSFHSSFYVRHTRPPSLLIFFFFCLSFITLVVRIMIISYKTCTLCCLALLFNILSWFEIRSLLM